MTSNLYGVESCDGFIICAAEAGASVLAFATDLVRLAWTHDTTILGEFNQHTLEARPGMTVSDVLTPFNEWQRRSYFGGDR